MSQNVSEDDVLFYGLLYVGFDELRQKKVKPDKNVERFRCFYGVGHKAVAALIKDLPSTDFDLRKLLLVLNYLKTYNTGTVMSGWWGVNEDTVRRQVKDYLKKIQELKKKKVRSLF